MFNVSVSQDGATSGGGGAGGGQVEFELEPPVIDTEMIVLIVYLGLCCVLGTIGNAFVFIIYYRKREKGTSTIFILSLAVTDFFTCLVNIPFTITALLLNYRLEYDFLCKMFLYIGTFNVPLSSLIMVAIGVDRYLCICHPFLHIVTVPRSKACVVVLTIISALVGIVPAMSHATYRYITESNFTSESNASTLDSSVPMMSNDSHKFVNSDPTRFFTNGIIMEPVVEFVTDIINRGVETNYRTDHVEFLTSTSASYSEVPYLNTTLLVHTPSVTKIIINSSSDAYFDGMCVESDYLLSKEFVYMYQHVYACIYPFEFFIIAFLYGLIYRSILVRRAWKTKRKRMSCYVSTQYQETVAEETQLTNINGGAAETVVLKKNQGRFTSAKRDRTLHANIKTAAMLFVVTVAFVASFLPSWMISLRFLPLQISVFYLFYINNMINPFIYAFMNRTFRDDLNQLMKNIFRRRI